MTLRARIKKIEEKILHIKDSRKEKFLIQLCFLDKENGETAEQAKQKRIQELHQQYPDFRPEYARIWYFFSEQITINLPQGRNGEQ